MRNLPCAWKQWSSTSLFNALNLNLSIQYIYIDPISLFSNHSCRISKQSFSLENLLTLPHIASDFFPNIKNLPIFLHLMTDYSTVFSLHAAFCEALSGLEGSKAPRLSCHLQMQMPPHTLTRIAATVPATEAPYLEKGEIQFSLAVPLLMQIFPDRGYNRSESLQSPPVVPPEKRCSVALEICVTKIQMNIKISLSQHIL